MPLDTKQIVRCRLWFAIAVVFALIVASTTLHAGIPVLLVGLGSVCWGNQLLKLFGIFLLIRSLGGRLTGRGRRAGRWRRLRLELSLILRSSSK